MPAGVRRPTKGPLVCVRCEEEKPRKEFRIVNSVGRNPRPHSYCNACLRKQVRLDVAKHRARLKRRR